MDTIKHLIVSGFLLFLVALFGTLGYMLIEGWSFEDSLFMTVITLSSVGYGEVHQETSAGRIFTMVLIFVGIGLVVYVTGLAVQFMVEGRLRLILGRRRVDMKIDRLKEHYIVCGYGRIGRVLCKKLGSKPLDIVVIEKNSDLISTLEKDSMLYINGDASEDANLLKAGIMTARGLVAALATDADNVFIVLSARQLNPNIIIYARASGSPSKSKLKVAGADMVESPYDMGAASMAQRILRPTVTNFLDLAFAHKFKEIQMEEIPVAPSSTLVDVMLKDSKIRQKFNLIIIAIKRVDNEMVFNPSFEARIKSGDTLIAVGEEQDLHALEKFLNPV